MNVCLSWQKILSELPTTTNVCTEYDLELWAGLFCIFAPDCNSWRGVNLQKNPAQGGIPGFICIFTPALHTLLKCYQMMVWICRNIQITTSELDFSAFLHQISCCNHIIKNKHQCYQKNLWIVWPVVTSLIILIYTLLKLVIYWLLLAHS